MTEPIREFYLAMGGVYPPGRECYNVYSISDDPADALESLHLQQQGCRLAHAYCREGATFPPEHAQEGPAKPREGRPLIRRTTL